MFPQGIFFSSTLTSQHKILDTKMELSRLNNIFQFLNRKIPCNNQVFLYILINIH